ncbi:Macrophage colony-stimulating factor 1 receptor [Neocucurbitaria cava]|uniref:Macrophage colony-stimulating factor 1 receptor n=1 Tax=Neocucurbitaria cava TaxID=798079 RepID=A0A9W8Y344_9PLEO|nr:Macrophage colony-stimulating factor 1 receptor [Neocucurbitaria cava]
MAGSIAAEPLDPRDGFNWVFLVELLICGILTIFFLFYFNRLFATLVSYGIRAYTWHTFHAYIDITSLQISPLGGRIFFKDIRYHAHNETILVHGGHITWNYWLRRVRDAGVYTDDEPPGDDESQQSPSTPDSRSASRSRNVDRAEKGGKQMPKQLPCRISIKLSGIEAFMYNRSPAYDGIIEAVRRKAEHEAKQDQTCNESVAESGNMHKDEEHHHHNKLKKADTGRSITAKLKKPELPAFLKLLPIHVDITKGAIVVGNEHTLAVITAQFEKASGTLDAGMCGPLDVYQQLFNFQVTHPVVHMKPNPDYKASQLDTAAHYKQEASQGASEESIIEEDAGRKRRRRWLTKLPSLSGLFTKSSDSIHTHAKSSGGADSKLFAPQWHFPGQERWKGLARYLDDSVNDGHGEWDGVEYAKTSLIADVPCVNVSFYWDVPGPVPLEIDNSRYIDPVRPNDINGSLPPDYGMDIQIFGGTINYGPWADRHRGVFQSMFFPGSHVDGVPTEALKPGDTRVLSVFKLYLGIEEDTVLRIPVREPSKDWKWKGKAHTLAAHDKPGTDKNKGKAKSRRRRGKHRDAAVAQNVRPFAWIDVKIASDSSVNYVMDMYASKSGFESKVDVDIKKTEISSSVNHGLLWRSGAIALDCDLSTPLGWDSLRKWLFNIKCQDLELFLLRDHLFLLTDLVADWGSGPPPDYFLFVPFQYLLNIDFTDFKLYLNTNDSNIINNPADLDDNNFIILYGKRLHGDVVIPLDKFRPLQNEIKFDVQGQALGLEILMPQKNTLKTFVQAPNVARLGGLTLKGSHTLMNETSAMNTDRLFMDIQGHRLDLELYGWLVHHFMKIKDNYFGDDMHFKTLEEFQGLPSVNLVADGTNPNGQPAKVSNDLDVILCISADQASVLLPANLYSAERSIRADLPYASADLRFTNYYMDLMVNFSPISVSLGGAKPSLDQSIEFTGGRTELFVDSTIICGHRLFGLPPSEPTYVCNWDFDVGRLSGECTSDFIETAAGAARSFAFTLDDDENSLPLTEAEVIHDATFLRLRTGEVHVWMHVAQEALLLKTSPISLDFNDLAGSTFSQKLKAHIPDLIVSAVDSKSASRHRTRAGEKHVVETHAFLQTTLSLDMLKRKLDFSDERSKQHLHMQVHDQRTNRTPFMFGDDPTPSHQRDTKNQNVRTPAMQYPDIPHPIFLFLPPSQDNGSFKSFPSSSDTTSRRGRPLRTNTSRSASSASLSNSIRSTRRHRTASKTSGSSRSRTLLGGSPDRFDREARFYTLPKEEERAKRNLPPSSVALSSSLATPYFPLDQVDPDLTDVPSFPALAQPFEERDVDGLEFSDVSTKHLDESFSHTSLLVRAERGIRVHCTPEFIRCVSKLIELVQPRRPEDILDDFQVKVMTKILDNRNRLEGKGSSIEFSVRIPFTHFRFQHGFDLQSAGDAGKDQYDVILNRLKTVARVKKYPGERAGENSLALHTTLGSLGVSVTERTRHGSNEDVAIQAEIKDVLLWMMQSKETSVNVAFRSFEAATASRKVDYLASLIHRTTLLADGFVANFIEVDQRQDHRLRYLAWYLTSVQSQYSDPAFLTKASYALRAARDHLRGHDSWKIISRFRYTWQCLPQDEKAGARDCSERSVECPANAEEKIIAMWDQWRTWDLAHVKKSLAMRLLFGRVTEKLPTPQTAPLHLDVKSASIKLIVDPGPQQSEVALRMLAINVALLPPTEPTGLMLVGTDTPKKSTTVQISSKESVLHIQWEICELAEALLALFQKENLRAAEKASSKAMTSSQTPATLYDHDFQVVFATDKAQIILDTINLRNTNTARHLQFSFIDADSKASGIGEVLTAHLHAEVAVSQLSSRSRSLATTQFQQPTLYFARVEHDKDTNVPDEIKAAAASRKIVVKVEEDVLGFIEVIDCVLKDEVAYFHRQLTSIQGASRETPKENKLKEKTTQLPNITLALFMDAYQIELALLHPLCWSITGSSGRIAVIPALGKTVSLRVDYDLEANLHRLYSNSSERSNIISSFELPPLNGRLTVTQNEKETKVLASGTIEKVQIQASEIQALATTMNKPEMSHMLQAIQDDVEVLKTHIDEIFPPSSEPRVVKAPSTSREILFGIQMTLSGMDIAASAPGQHPDSPTANLAFRLSSVQLKVTNIGSDQSIMVYPEAAIQIHEVTVDLSLTDSKTIRKCGNLTFSATFRATTEKDSDPARRVYRLRSSGLEVNVFADTASAVVDVMNHLQDKIKDLDLSKEKKYFRRLRHTKSRINQKRDKSPKDDANADDDSIDSGALFTSTYSLELLDLQASWIIGNSVAAFPRSETEDLVLSFGKIDLSTQKDDAARLMIEDMRLQTVPISANKRSRSLNSALLPKMVFNVAYASTKDTRKLAFQAAGKSLDLQLDSRFILPANVIERSVALAGKKFREASANWSMTPTTTGAQRKNPFGNKRLASLTVDANFAGAVVHINGNETVPVQGSSNRSQQKGRYSQFVGDGSKSSMAMRAPGVAVRVEYQDNGSDPSLTAEVRVDGSTNTLLPTVVPIIIDISDSIKAVVREKDSEGSPSSPEDSKAKPKPAAKLLEEDNIMSADPTTLLGRTRLNLGLRICKQEFSLSCQPIARVTAIAKVDDIYLTVNSVKSQEHGHFFAASAAFEKLQATVQHVYSRESTFGLDVDSIVLSLMNSKHVSGTSGISAILKINPTALQINARQLQDFLLFREIWVPPEIRRASKPPASPNHEPQEYLMQRYQQVTAATAFPWNANVAIADVKVDLDLGQAIGKSSLHIHNMWASSKKSTTWEQNLCIGVENIGIESTGRTSGFVELHGIKVRTSIGWPLQDTGVRRSPLIQASIAFQQLRVKTGFDYQAFLMADIANFAFLMYNAREEGEDAKDRLVAILDGDKVHVYCHATSAAQGLALWQAIERLIQENQHAYRQSLRDIEKFLRRKSSVSTAYSRSACQSQIITKPDNDTFKAPISLHTDVVVTLRSIKFGVFPSTFVDQQLLLLEAGDMQARFAVALETDKIHSSLGMTLGQLSVALSSVPTPKKSISVTELTVEDVVESTRSARGGTILRVPKVIATMHTWQVPRSNHIDYLFRSSLEGKVDVGWNYSRISYIRTMWSNHSRTLASRLGKPLPESNIKISTSQTLQDPSSPSTDTDPSTPSTTTRPRAPSLPSSDPQQQEKITAVVNVPQSKYDYTPLEPPLIETPQLRDMGEATPPLEWIGLNRDRLPNVTHQIVIVSLLEVAREVEEAYERILGSS